MTLLNPPAYLQGGTYTAVHDRQSLITARCYKDTARLANARGGLLPHADLWSAFIAWTGFTVTISPFHAIVQNNFAADAGDYEVINYNNEVRTITSSSPTTNRIDIVGVQVFDAFYAGAVSNADVVVIQGTATAGTPADPVLPNGFEPFYRLTVNANSTQPIVTSLRRRTGLVGTVVPIFDTQLANAGANTGEAQLLSASGVMPTRQRIWGADSAWHGVTPFAVDFGGWLLTSAATDRIIATLTMPDPGYSYKLVFSGSVWAGIDPNNGWRFAAREGTTAAGTAYAQGGYETRDSVFNGANSIPVVGSSPALTGARTVSLWAQRKFGAATQGCSVSSESELCVLVVPV